MYPMKCTYQQSSCYENTNTESTKVLNHGISLSAVFKKFIQIKKKKINKSLILKVYCYQENSPEHNKRWLYLTQGLKAIYE